MKTKWCAKELYHECEVMTEKSGARDHCSTSLVMLQSDTRDWLFYIAYTFKCNTQGDWMYVDDIEMLQLYTQTSTFIDGTISFPIWSVLMSYYSLNISSLSSMLYICQILIEYYRQDCILLTMSLFSGDFVSPKYSRSETLLTRPNKIYSCVDDGSLWIGFRFSFSIK